MSIVLQNITQFYLKAYIYASSKGTFKLKESFPFVQDSSLIAWENCICTYIFLAISTPNVGERPWIFTFLKVPVPFLCNNSNEISYDGVIIIHTSTISAGSAFDAIIHKPFFINVIIFIHFYRWVCGKWKPARPKLPYLP